MIGSIIAFDASVEQALFAIRTPFFINFFEWITFLGNPLSITVLAISVAVVLIRNQQRDYVMGLAVTIFGSLLGSFVLKLLVLRDRPLPPLPAIDVTGYSFPSMHAAMSMALYGFLAYTTYRLLHPPHHRLPWIIVLFVLIAFIGFSRLYLGVHFASDVLAGYLVGALFVLLGIFVTRISRR